MSFLKLMNARSKSGQQPSMKAMSLSEQQQRRADQGRCIQCGTNNTDPHSYICIDCQAEDTIDDIRDDIKTLRQKILNRSGD